jgi:lipopolysaccharide transport system permease protein
MSFFSTALADITAANRKYRLAGMLGWSDLRARYRRSTLGPFWITISMGVMVGALGVVFGSIFKSPMQEYLPFLAAGIIIWGFLASAINESGDVFVAAGGIIKQLPIPLFTHVMRMIWRNVLILAHNILIFPFVLLVVQKPLTWTAFMALPGFLLVTLNLTWIVLLLGVFCTRYRDLPQIVASITQVCFFITPVMWMPNLLPARAGLYLLDCNPFNHLLELIRAPLLGQMPAALSWGACAAMAVVGWFFTLLIYGRYKKRIAYWL